MATCHKIAGKVIEPAKVIPEVREPDCFVFRLTREEAQVVMSGLAYSKSINRELGNTIFRLWTALYDHGVRYHKLSLIDGGASLSLKEDLS